MLAALEALVKLESPTEDLAACQDVVRLASDLAATILGTPAEIREVNGRPVFGGARKILMSSYWPTQTQFGLKALSHRYGKLKERKQLVLEFLI